MIKTAKDYAAGEAEHIPASFDDNSKRLIGFMLIEAFNAGMQAGYSMGMVRAHEVFADTATELLEKARNYEKTGAWDVAERSGNEDCSTEG